ncbi:MAG: hypothetical protein GF372_06630, partial [Candidatus Marinimicrobia bacterium]|nr:hypothetical protein [Candidatus Neomarinimicrobiota bacterium]
MNLFDTCIITASDEAQKKVFEELLQNRISHGLYPRELDFKVYSDPESGRIGSGGGTIWAMHQYLKENSVTDIAAFLTEKRILMIHAGGESRRNPMYVPEGKLFTPVPVPTSSIYPPTVLDMQLTLFLKYPWKKNGEIIVSSGDVVIDFDCEQVPKDRGDICGFTKPVSLEQGARHGVFQFDENKQHVTDYFQKESEAFLKENARLEGSEECALDMGIIAFSSQAMTSLLEYAADDTSKGFSLISELQQGQANLDLYLEILTACLKNISFDEFLERISNRTTLGEDRLQDLFHELNRYNLTGILTKKTTFLHFGTLNELPVSGLELHRKELLPFYASENDEIIPHFYNNQVILNSDHLQVEGDQAFYAESCSNVQLENQGENLFSGLENFRSEKEFARGICLDFRRIGDLEYFLIYGIEDTFKPQDTVQEVIFCNTRLSDWLRERSLKAEDIFSDSANPDLLNAKLFWENPSPDDVYGYFNSDSVTDKWVEKFKTADRRSIREINNSDSAIERELRRIAFRKNQIRDQFQNFIGWRTISREDFLSTFQHADLEHLTKFYNRTEDNLLKEYRHTLLKELSDDAELNSASSGFVVEYVAEEPGNLTLKKSIKDDQIVWARSPVRLDLAGGWSDTPPYTLREGGQVTNLAVDLNGQPPIQVF